MDVEACASALGGTPFGTSLALLVGVAAVMGTTLRAIEMHARKGGDGAQLTARASAWSSS